MADQSDNVTLRLDEEEQKILWALHAVTGDTRTKILKDGLRLYLEERQADPEWPDKVKAARDEHASRLLEVLDLKPVGS